MHEKNQLFGLKIGEEIDKIYRNERNDLEILKKKHAENGTLDGGLYAGDFLNHKVKKSEMALRSIYRNFKKYFLDGNIDTLEKKELLFNKLQLVKSNTIEGFENSLQNESSIVTSQKQILVKKFEHHYNEFIHTLQREAEIEFFENTQNEKQIKESELSELILKELYKKDKENGTGIYNIDDIARKFQELDFFKIQRIVEGFVRRGFVKDYCSKSYNKAELTAEGIRYIEEKSRSLKDYGDKTSDIMKNDILKFKNKAWLYIKRVFLKAPTIIKILCIFLFLILLIILWEHIKKLIL